MRQKDSADKRDGRIIGSIAKPPFVRLPEPERLFTMRAARFRQHAPGSPLKPYLELLAAISDAQSGIQEGLELPAPPDAERIERARQHSMPLLDRNAALPDRGFDQLLDRFLDRAASFSMPDAARSALQRLLLLGPEGRHAMALNVLSDAIPFDAIAEHMFIAAVCQVHFARLAAALDPDDLQPVGDGICPACGGAPVASLIVNWPQAVGTRFCACCTCSTLWNYVRARCSACGATKDISFREVEGGNGTVKAEVCECCRGYVKVLYRDKDPALDPVADDVASLGLDLLVKELGYRRGAVNPFLVGY